MGRHMQWCIAKMEVDIRKGALAKGLKVPCLFMITEVSIRCQKKPGGWYTAYTRVYPPTHHWTYATRGVPYYRVSRIFMSRIFSVATLRSVIEYGLVPLPFSLEDSLHLFYAEQQSDSVLHFLRLLEVWWPGTQSARGDHLLACNCQIFTD